MSIFYFIVEFKTFWFLVYKHDHDNGYPDQNIGLQIIKFNFLNIHKSNPVSGQS